MLIRYFNLKLKKMTPLILTRTVVSGTFKNNWSRLSFLTIVVFVSRKYLDTKYLFSFFLGNDETHRDSYTLENNYGPFPRVTDVINFAVIFLSLFPGSQP